MSYQYRYKLVVSKVETIKDEKGNFKTVTETQIISECRHSYKTSKEFKADEIKTVLATYVVYMPLDNYNVLKELKIGQKVQVLDDNGDILAEGSILGKNKGYYNYRIWL